MFEPNVPGEERNTFLTQLTQKRMTRKSEWQECYFAYKKQHDDLKVLSRSIDTSANEIVKTEDLLDSLYQDVEAYEQDLGERLSEIPYQLQESSILNSRIALLEQLLAEISESRENLTLLIISPER